MKPTKVELIRAGGTFILRLYSRPMTILGSKGPDFQTVWSGKGLASARRMGKALSNCHAVPFLDRTRDLPRKNKYDKVVYLYRRHEKGLLSRASLVTQLRKLGVPLEEIRFQLDGH
jgi:hypothetical protein